jgi:dolichol-phosphate mannosyltransferase
VRTLVVVPTYDERESLPVTLAELRRAVPDVDVLVVDDASPDGTGEWAERAARRDPRMHVLHRAGKEGLGRAYVAGFGWALDRDYDVVVEMDADGSHRPEDLPSVLAALPGADLVIGSRWVPGGAVRNWPVSRMLLSRCGTWFARRALRLQVQDATAGFRAYPARTLRRIPLEQIESQGYCFQIDMTWRVARAGGRVVEVPITFVERTQGRSKMSRAIAVEAIARLVGWGLQDRRRRLRRRVQALRRRA